MRRYGMDSMWIAVAFGLGIGLGYVRAASECSHIKQAMEEQAIFINGRWVYRPEIIEVLKERGRAQKADYR